MIRYNATELRACFSALDAELTRDVSITVIGGAALAIAYGSRHTTTDVDLMTAPERDFWDAVDRAAARSGLKIPISQTSIVEYPESYNERLERVEFESLNHLRIYVPERHDLALMKVARGEEHDLQGIEDIHSRNPLNLSTLIERYHEMLPIGSVSMFRIKFLDLVARLFGEAEADRLDEKLGEPGQR